MEAESVPHKDVTRVKALTDEIVGLPEPERADLAQAVLRGDEAGGTTWTGPDCSDSFPWRIGTRSGRDFQSDPVA